jgi:hypothetical protein
MAGRIVATWARVNGAGKVVWVGVTFPLSLAENLPPPGSGPAGAIAVLNYPPVVQQTTYFNHFELHWQPDGHGTDPAYETSDRYSAPHFDFHFYSIPVAQVWPIPLAFAPLPDVPEDRLPAGYAQPEQFSVPEMGRHSAVLSEFTAIGLLDVTMIAGFLPDGSYMHFLEPMISPEVLLLRKNFTLPVPRPDRLGRPTSYPSDFVIHYDKDVDAYHMVFKGFEPLQHDLKPHRDPRPLVLPTRIVAVGIPGASAISGVGTFLAGGPIHDKPEFAAFTEPDEVLDPMRILVGSRSNFGAPLANPEQEEGSLLSIDPGGSEILIIPPRFAAADGQASTLGGRVRMFSANSPAFLNGINTPGADTADFAGVGNPLGIVD